MQVYCFVSDIVSLTGKATRRNPHDLGFAVFLPMLARVLLGRLTSVC